MLRRDGIALELLDADLRVVARGVRDERSGALVAYPEGEFDEGAGLLVHVARLPGTEDEIPFEVEVGAGI